MSSGFIGSSVIIKKNDLRRAVAVSSELALEDHNMGYFCYVHNFQGQSWNFRLLGTEFLANN